MKIGQKDTALVYVSVPYTEQYHVTELSYDILARQQN